MSVTPIQLKQTQLMLRLTQMGMTKVIGNVAWDDNIDRVNVMVTYGLTIENEKYIINKPSSKKDGVYQARGVAYRVRNGKVTHYASGGKVIEIAYGFNCIIGRFDGYSSEAVKVLKSIWGERDGKQIYHEKTNLLQTSHSRIRSD